MLPVSAIAALLLCLCPASQSLDYCVIPDAGDCGDCPFNNAPCHTLQYYANNSNFTSNTIFHFFEGEHTLSTVVEVTNVANLSLVGHQNLSRVQCNTLFATFVVKNFTNLRVENLSFCNCSSGMHLYSAALQLTNGSGLSIDHVTFSSGRGAIVARSLRDHSSISNSTFLDATTINVGGYVCTGPSHLSINNCTFLHGEGWAIQLYIWCPYVHVSITNLVLSGNIVDTSLAIFFSAFTGNFVEMSNITISNSSSNGSSVYIEVGDDLPDLDPSSCGRDSTHHPHYLMEISNITITGNNGTAFMIFDKLNPRTDCIVQHILMRDSVVTEGVLSVWAIQIGLVSFWNVYHQFKAIHVTLKNVSISSNIIEDRNSSTELILHASTYFPMVQNVTVIDCTFENNQMTAILAEGSSLLFQGKHIFRNNSAVNGAGIRLLRDSYLYLLDNTDLTFVDNYASERGGAIYLDAGILKESMCTIQYFYNDVQFKIHNNTARAAGSSLYWITPNECMLSMDSKIEVQSLLGSVFSFQLKNTESDPSAISSDPIRICQCISGHRMPDCNAVFPSISTYPGEDFTLRLAVVGTMNGTVPGTIHAKFPPSSPQARLSDLQDTQPSKYAYCDDFTYTVHSSKPSVYFHLTATEFSPILNISIDLKACPIGFALNNVACKCDHVISQEGIRCFINKQSILRPANTWIGFMNYSNETGVMFSDRCPQGYCLSHEVNLTSDAPDIQCAANRMGVLCGQCVKNYSLTLGHQRCSECSSLYLLLLFPLAACGLVLVAVLFVLNLTVTAGSINGLIFYANVISMSHSTHYSGTSSQLYTFIAWLNLDLGIDTCFFDGMDAYTETWLQFAFPLYLWLIIAAIIAICNVFPKLTQRGTQNSVKVLATLLLLSYTKLQRTLVTIFSFTTLRYPSGAVHYVWLYDANIHFLQGKHIYLFIAGMLILCLLVLPYTFGLALFQYLQGCSGRRVCRWVNQLKPVFDAYAGPYKDWYRTWTGLLLVTRTLLINLFSINITGSPDFNYFVILIISLALLFFSTRGIYNKWPCDVLEAFFYLQLGIFSGGTIYASHNSGNMSFLANFSFATTLLVFLVIVGYHAFSSFRKVGCCRKGEEALDPEEEEQLLFRDRGRLDPVLSHRENKGD